MGKHLASGELDCDDDDIADFAVCIELILGAINEDR
jgi:hypothetical protein